jgi:hypothetical protein
MLYSKKLHTIADLKAGVAGAFLLLVISKPGLMAT